MYIQGCKMTCITCIHNDLCFLKNAQNILESSHVRFGFWGPVLDLGRLLL